MLTVFLVVLDAVAAVGILTVVFGYLWEAQMDQDVYTRSLELSVVVAFAIYAVAAVGGIVGLAVVVLAIIQIALRGRERRAFLGPTRSPVATAVVSIGVGLVAFLMPLVLIGELLTGSV